MSSAFSDVKDLGGARFSDGRVGVGQTIVINSKDRVAGYPGVYEVVLNPKLNEVFVVALKSFTGSVTPFNIYPARTFMIQIHLGPFTESVMISIQPGTYTLQNLIDYINTTQDILRFTYDPNTGRVIVERVLKPGNIPTVGGNITAGDTLNGTVFSGDNVISALLGFPGPIPKNPAIPYAFILPTGTSAIQSTLAVPTLVAVRSLLIAFDDISSSVVTTGNIAGSFIIPLSGDNYNSAKQELEYKEGTEWPQQIRVNNKSLSRIRVRLLDANDGSPFLYVGDHTMTLVFYHTRSGDSK